MASRLYRVSFHAQPIVVHASDEKEAVETAIKYLRQPETTRITVEPNDSDRPGSPS